MPFPAAAVQLPPQFPRYWFQMHEVAETTSGAFSHFILAAAGFPEVSDWGELCVDGLAIEPAVVQVHNGFLCILLVTKLDIDIADEVVT